MRQRIVVSVAALFVALAGLGGFLLDRSSPVTTAAGATGSAAASTNCTYFAGLPPSMDNDAGHARSPDTTPDADCDWSQTHAN